MKELTLKQNLEKYPYLKQLAKTILFVEKDEYENYENNVSFELFRNLLSDDNRFRFIFKTLVTNNESLKIGYLSNGMVEKSKELTRIELVREINKFLKSNKLALDSICLNRLNVLSKKFNYEKFQDKYLNQNFNLVIDNENVSIPIKVIIDFLSMPENAYEKFYSQDGMYNGIDKKCFIYAIKRFIDDNDLLNNYTFPDLMYDRMIDIKYQPKMDIEAINKMLENSDKNLKLTVVNEKLKQAILKDIPSELYKLQQAIYIYIKMCSLLTYDGEFYAVKQQGPVARRHEDINNVSNITLDSNEVVCYEFTAIYAKILDEMGIKFEIDSNFTKEFGGGHANLTFRYDKFLIRADAVTDILDNDLIRVKTNQELRGLKCRNKNRDTRDEFNEIVENVYKVFIDKEASISSKNFDEVVEEYQNIKTPMSIPFNERFAILTGKINEMNMDVMDNIGYILHLRRILFSFDEIKDNILVDVYSNKETNPSNKLALPLLIFIVNEKHVKNIDSNKYFVYSSNLGLKEITQDELAIKINSGILSKLEDEEVHRCLRN